MKSLLKLVISFTFIAATLVSFALPVSAQLKVNPTDTGQKDQTGNISEAFSSTFDTSIESIDQSLPAQVGRVIEIFVSFAGVIMLVYIVYAGILWMTAGGNETQVGKAKTIMRNAIIGLIIVILAYALVSFVNSQIVNTLSGKRTIS